MDSRSITAISLCAGIAGLDLGIDIALGGRLRTIAYVEREAGAAAILEARMQDGAIVAAPIWGDLLTICEPEFSGYVREALGGRTLDILFGGIPCQPWSLAGKQLGNDDERDLWPGTARAVEFYAPRVVFIENVPGILGPVGGARKIAGDLERLGYCVSAGLFSAEEIGASHKRLRLFILGVDDSARNERCRRDGQGRRGRGVRETGDAVADAALRRERQRLGQQAATGTGSESGVEGLGGAMGHAEHSEPRAGVEQGGATGERRDRPAIAGDVVDDSQGIGRREGRSQSIVRSGRDAACGADVPVGDAGGARLQVGIGDGRIQRGTGQPHAGQGAELSGLPLFPPGPGDADAWRYILDRWEWLAPALANTIGGRRGTRRNERAEQGGTVAASAGEEATQPDVRRVVNESTAVLDRIDRLRACGNGVVPLTAATAFVSLLARHLCDGE